MRVVEVQEVEGQEGEERIHPEVVGQGVAVQEVEGQGVAAQGTPVPWRAGSHTQRTHDTMRFTKMAKITNNGHTAGSLVR